MRRPSGRTTRPTGETAVVSGVFAVSWASTSDLPGLEVDPRIDPGIGEVRDEVHDQPDKGEDVERREHHRIVAVEHALEAEQAEPVEREDRLDQQRAGKERMDEGAGKPGDDDQHGVAENVAVERLTVVAALGARREHVLLTDLVE